MKHRDWVVKDGELVQLFCTYCGLKRKDEHYKKWHSSAKIIDDYDVYYTPTDVLIRCKGCGSGHILKYWLTGKGPENPPMGMVQYYIRADESVISLSNHIKDFIDNKIIETVKSEARTSCSEEFTFEQLEQKIIQWAKDRGLNETTNQKDRLAKCLEEFGELASGINKNDSQAVLDGIGDTTVVLCQIAHAAGYSMSECLKWAYNEIKDRTGKIVDGTFIKDGD